MEENKLFIIGTGPGESELLTIKAARILKEAEIIFYPASNGKNTALDIVREYINEEKAEKIALEFPMISDRKHLEEKWDYNAKEIAKYLSMNKKCIFITLGDPAFYSTFYYIKDFLDREGFKIEIVPGVTSFSAGVSKASEVLAIARERVIVVPYLREDERLEFYIDNFECVVLMKMFKTFLETVKVMQSKNALRNSILICNVGMSDERIYKGEQILEAENLGYFTTLIIKKDVV